MHSSAAWEITTGISDEWVFGGDDGEAYMLALRDLAIECGIETPFYTCTAWGGAITPDEMVPLWGGYAYRPWLFYTARGEHPVTEEYIYQDYHNNEAVVTSDFKPAYQPEDRPYSCCEMGGGMMCTYYYRFVLPYKSVDAMANIKLASGCNFLGYYVFQGGTNPIGKHGTYMNEAQTPKISYDYQAALGEFGQIRESYQRLKALHYFTDTFGELLCSLQTVLPEGASMIDPADLDTLRFAVRTDGKTGFLFLNNFQDHAETTWKKQETVNLYLKEETITFSNLSLAPDENCILPFHMDVAGMDLVQAAAQPVTVLPLETPVYVFLKPEGMEPVFHFEEGAVTDQGNASYVCSAEKEAEFFTVKHSRSDASAGILCVSRDLANEMYRLKDGTLLFAGCAVLEDENGIRLETASTENRVLTFPKGTTVFKTEAAVPAEGTASEAATELEKIFDVWSVRVPEKKVPLTLKQTASSKYEVTLPDGFMDGLKDCLLQIDYRGDIGWAFLDGELINDNFCNNATWEIGLRTFAKRLESAPLTLSISPLREGKTVNVESAMAARMENAQKYVAELLDIRTQPIYEIVL